MLSSRDILDILQMCLIHSEPKMCFVVWSPCTLWFTDVDSVVRVYIVIGANTYLRPQYTLICAIQVHSTNVYNQINSFSPLILLLISHNIEAVHYFATGDICKEK